MVWVRPEFETYNMGNFLENYELAAQTELKQFQSYCEWLCTGIFIMTETVLFLKECPFLNFVISGSVKVMIMFNKTAKMDEKVSMYGWK